MPPKKKRKSNLPALLPGRLEQYLRDNFSVIPSHHGLLNGHVVFMYIENGRSYGNTILALLEQTSISVPRSKVVSLVNRCFKCRNLAQDSEKHRLDEICYQEFVPLTQESPLPTAEAISPQVSSCVSVPLPVSGPCSLTISPASTLTSVPDCNPMSSMPSTSSTRHSTRGDPLTPRKKRLRARLDFVSDSKRSLKKKYQMKIQQMREKLSKSVSRSQYNQALRRKKEIIDKLRRHKQEHQCGDIVVELKEELRKLRRKHRRLKVKKAGSSIGSSSSNMKKINEQARKLKEKDETIRALQDENLCLIDAVEELKAGSEVLPSKRDGKTYSCSTRMMVFDAVVQQVPTVNIPPLLESWSRRMGMEMTEIPRRQTVEQMGRELGVISSFQAAEVAMETDNLTLGFDATTQEGTHINSIHFTTVDKCIVVAIDELAGGTAADYQRHVCDSVDELAFVYSSFNNLDYQECRSTIIGNISNTMTDRVPVNHAAIELIKERWGAELNELNCHLHPLDTIASSCRAALKTLENERGTLFGKDCMAGNIVLQMNKMRYKDGKGDPKGFVVFLDDNKLPRGILPRYRGNRLHVLFHICGKLVQYHSLFLEFLATGAGSCGGLSSSLRKDFAHKTAQLEMQVLGLFGKLLSGPWMKTFYTSAEDQIPHTEGIQVVRDVVSVLKGCVQDPIEILNRTTDFFGNTLDENDKCLKKLVISPSDPVLQESMSEMLSACLKAVITVLERQYDRYFGLELTDALREETKSARSHNIDAEEVMGMFSAAKQRSPNATICYLSSRMRAKKNRTVEYLDNMDSEKREKLVRWSIGRGRKRRELNRKKQKQLVADMSRRAAAKRQKKTEKELRAVEQHLRQTNLDKLAMEFPELDNADLMDLSDILCGRAIGRSICHTWYDKTTQTKTVYCGHIKKFKSKKSKKYVVAYWTDEESYDDAVDYDMPKFELGVDLICQNLKLC